MTPINPSQRPNLTRFAWLSIGAAILTITLKTTAYLITGSVGLLSDAVESIVNLIGAIIALGMLTIAALPPDDDHSYGHSKAEYFSSVMEGVLILVAAVTIGYTAITRLIHPEPLEQLGIGLVVSAVASCINLAASRVILAAGKKHRSITLEADAQHLMTDVWTSAGVIVGVIIVSITGWLPLDPIMGLIVAANIVWMGVQLIRRSIAGLMDTTLPGEDLARLNEVIQRYQSKGIKFHAIRTRQSAARRFISMHVLVPGHWSVHDAHHIAEEIEMEIHTILEEAFVFTHLEPLEDEISMADEELVRG